MMNVCAPSSELDPSVELPPVLVVAVSPIELVEPDAAPLEPSAPLEVGVTVVETPAVVSPLSPLSPCIDGFTGPHATNHPQRIAVVHRITRRVYHREAVAGGPTAGADRRWRGGDSGAVRCRRGQGGQRADQGGQPMGHSTATTRPSR
jgi:hypothetical protein